MPKTKKIRLINYEGFQCAQWGARTLWSDTWVRYRDRRKLVCLGPTILSMGDVRRDMEWHGEDYGKEDWHEKPELPIGAWCCCLPYGLDGADNAGLPVILVNEDYLTTERIERAIEWYLREHRGITAPMKFHWQKHTGSFYRPW
jgi:hypothetical protein